MQVHLGSGPVVLTPIDLKSTQANAAATANTPVPRPAEKPPFTPAPPIRPTVQDLIDFDRTLLSMRRG